MKKKIISLPTSAFTLHLRLCHRKDRRKKIELVKKGVYTNSLKSADENARKLSLRYSVYRRIANWISVPRERIKSALGG